jgi:DHA1 family bicyclomycin/chloramphenicol resistance-like MFS transporter
MLLLLALQWGGVDALEVLLAMLFVGFGFLGMVVPTTAVLALDGHGPIAGTASALMGTLQFLTGAVVMATVGTWVDGTALPMVVGIALAAVVAWTFAVKTLPREAAIKHAN